MPNVLWIWFIIHYIPLCHNSPTPMTHLKIYIILRILAMNGTVASEVCKDGNDKSPRWELPKESIQQLVGLLFENSHNGQLGCNIVPKLAKQFGVHRSTIYIRNKRAKDSLHASQLDLTTKRKQSGRKSKKNLHLLQAQMVDMPPGHEGLCGILRPS